MPSLIFVSAVSRVRSSSSVLACSSGSGGATFNGLTLAALNLTTTGTETLDAGTYTIGTGTYAFGAITLNGAIVLGQATNFGAATFGSATTLTDSAGTVGFTSTVNGANALTVSGNASFGGTVGVANALTSLTVTGSTTLGSGAPSLKTTGAQNYAGGLTLGATTTTLTTTSNGLVTIGANVSGASDTLTISSGSGGATFNGLTLAALTLTTTGTETLNAGTYAIGLSTGTFNFGAVTLNGAIVLGQATTFTGAATLGSNTTLTATNKAITFASTLNSAGATPEALTINTNSGLISFGGSVGATHALGPLSLANSGGTTNISGGTVVTSGGQTYGGVVTLVNNATLSDNGSGNIVFDQTVGGAGGLTVTTAGGVTFDGSIGAVGAFGALASLTITTGGTATHLFGPGVTTTGNQSFGNAVVLHNGVDFQSTGNGAINFQSTVDAAGIGVQLIVAEGGTLTFGNSVGATGQFFGITDSVSGGTTIAGATIATSGGGGQTYNGALTLTDAGTTFSDSTGASIAFVGAISGATTNLVVNSGAGNVTFDGATLGGLSVTTSGTEFVNAGTYTIGSSTPSTIRSRSTARSPLGCRRRSAR